MLNRPPPLVRNEPSDQGELIGRSADDEIPANGQPPQITPRDRISYLVVLLTTIGAVCTLIVLGTIEGISYGRYWHQQEVRMADVTVNLDQASNDVIDNTLFPGGSHWVRLWAPIATQRRLSLFATGAVAHYAKEGLFPDIRDVSTRIAKPVAGATLSGGEFLDAGATSEQGVTAVEFRLSGGTLHDAPIAAATHTIYGWIAGWNTANVPNGIYTLESVAFGSTGPERSQSGRRSDGQERTMTTVRKAWEEMGNQRPARGGPTELTRQPQRWRRTWSKILADRSELTTRVPH